MHYRENDRGFNAGYLFKWISIFNEPLREGPRKNDFIFVKRLGGDGITRGDELCDLSLVGVFLVGHVLADENSLV